MGPFIREGNVVVGSLETSRALHTFKLVRELTNTNTEYFTKKRQHTMFCDDLLPLKVHFDYGIVCPMYT